MYSKRILFVTWRLRQKKYGFFIGRKTGRGHVKGHLGPGTGKNIPVEVVVMAMRACFRTRLVTKPKRLHSFSSSPSSNLRKVIDLKPL
jgi:hypothetical protein